MSVQESVTRIPDKYVVEFKKLNETYEEVLDSKMQRYEALPINEKYRDIYDLYETHKHSFWDASEIDFSKDREGYEKLDENEKHFIKYVLAFFAYSDAVVNNNIGECFGQEVQIPEALMFYNFQGSMEDIHNITYSLMIHTLISSEAEIKELQDAVKTIPVLAKKKDWAEYWTERKDSPFHVRLIAFAIVEGIFFSASFCAIYWIKKNKNNTLPALTESNEFIARDENLHTKNAVALYHHLNGKVSQELVHDIFTEAVNIELEFITESLPCSLIGMSASKMTQYVKYVADRLLIDLGYEKLFKLDNPFEWMESISLENKTNFFEHNTTEYSKAGKVSDFKVMSNY